MEQTDKRFTRPEKVEEKEKSRRFFECVQETAASTTSNENEELQQNGFINFARSFFEGELVAKQLDELRKSIVHIRTHWDEYDKFVSTVKTLLEQHEINFENWKDLLAKKRDWSDRSNVSKDDFEALCVYTMPAGYQQIFKIINTMFRNDATAEDALGAVFLVELINIDLFNYCRSESSKSNFQGTVYRGMAVKESDLDSYKEYMNKAIGKRFISVPLSLQSSSAMVEKALEFAETEIQKHPEMIPVLMKINVIGMSEERLKMYQERFPTSVVSTICAVDISEISAYPEEKEVLLRGAFYTVLRVSESPDKLVAGKNLWIIDMVMVNSNRDHISTAHLQEQDTPARTMFGTLVGLTRMEYALEYYKRLDMSSCIAEYEEAVDNSRRRLQELLNN